MRHFLVKLSAALVAYGPLGVLLLTVLDSVGVPLPGALDLLFLDVAVHSAQEPWRAYFTALVAVIGSLAGNIALFQAVRHGRRLMGKTEAKSGQPQRFQEWFRRFGLMTVFIPAMVPLVPLPLKVFVISAALFQTPLLQFAAVIVLARVIRYFGMAWLGLQLGADAQGFLTRHGWHLSGGVLAFLMAVYAVMEWTGRRRSRQEDAAADASL
jgi:membrane protein YqaA with SNARE-associated domain